MHRGEPRHYKIPPRSARSHRLFTEILKKTMTRKRLAWGALLFCGNALAQEPHHHDFAADVDAFHAVLAPVWHARPGKARLQDACAKAGRMEALAADIRSADATALRASIAALKTSCKSRRSEVDGALHDVHEAFHDLIGHRPGQ